MNVNRNLIKFGLPALAILIIVSGLFFFLGQSATAKGVVTARREANNTYFVTFTYLAPEPSLPGKPMQTYTKQSKVSFGDYNYYYEGTEVTVKYPTDSPQNAELVNQSDNNSGLLIIVGVTTGAIVVVLGLTTLFLRRRARES